MAIRVAIVFAAATFLRTSVQAEETGNPTSISYLQKTSAHAPDGSPLMTSHSEIFIQNNRKREVNEVGVIIITDGDTGESVTIFPTEKRFVRYGSPKQQSADKSSEAAIHEFHSITAVPSGDGVESIGNQVIDNRRCLGLRTVVEKGPTISIRTFWYEDGTKRPRLVTWEASAKGRQTHTIELSRFRYAAIDPAEFSMDAPANFKVEEGSAPFAFHLRTTEEPSSDTDK